MKKKILLVLTSAFEMDGKHKTGVWLSEFADAFLEFEKAGYSITVASIAGGDVPLDPGSIRGKVPNEILETEKYLKDTAQLKDIQDQDKFDAIFLPGGHGTMFDFPGNAELQELLANAYEENRIVAAVCHGPAGFVGVRLSDGQPLVKGKRITSFTDSEERATGLEALMPFMLESKLREEGAEFVAADNWTDHIEADGNLISGQNPQSTASIAKAVIAKLESK